MTAAERITIQPSHFRLSLNPRMELVAEGAYHSRRINLPTSDKIAAIIPEESGEYKSRDIILAGRDKNSKMTQLTRIPATHTIYIPSHYVLLFPYGDYG